MLVCCDYYVFCDGYFHSQGLNLLADVRYFYGELELEPVHVLVYRVKQHVVGVHLPHGQQYSLYRRLAPLHRPNFAPQQQQHSYLHLLPQP
jgi:hypothetical protein